MSSDFIKAAIEKERNKTRQERVEDFAYTLNHALACTATDFIDPFVNALSERYLKYKISVSWHPIQHKIIDLLGLEHDEHDDEHVHSSNCSHGSHDNGSDNMFENFHKTLGHWLVSEMIGDLGAVPVTLAMQYFFPGTMARISQGMEYAIGNEFRASSMVTATKWAIENNIDTKDPQVQEYADKIYKYEVDHFGQAALWTVSSTLLNVFSNKYLFGEENTHIGVLLLSKTVGSLMTVGVVMSARGVFPERAHKWDQWTADNIYRPVSNLTGNLLGVDSDKLQEKLAHSHSRSDINLPTPTAKAVKQQNQSWQAKLAHQESQKDSTELVVA